MFTMLDMNMKILGFDEYSYKLQQMKLHENITKTDGISSFLLWEYYRSNTLTHPLPGHM